MKLTIDHELNNIRATLNNLPSARGKDIEELQQWLRDALDVLLEVDGELGPRTMQALNEYTYYAKFKG